MTVSDGVGIGIGAVILALALFCAGVEAGRSFEREDLRNYCARGWLTDKTICDLAAK